MGRFSILAALVLLSAMSVMAQGIQGVHPDSDPLQVGVGFTFVSFHEAPSITTNNAASTRPLSTIATGLASRPNCRMLSARRAGKNSQILFTGGGVRLRWPNARSIQPWFTPWWGISHLSAAGFLRRRVGGGLQSRRGS